MAKIVMVVDVKDRTAAELVRDAGSIGDLGQGRKPGGWSILALLWTGDLENVQATAVVDMITDDLPIKPTCSGCDDAICPIC